MQAGCTRGQTLFSVPPQSAQTVSCVRPSHDGKVIPALKDQRINVKVTSKSAWHLSQQYTALVTQLIEKIEMLLGLQEQKCKFHARCFLFVPEASAWASLQDAAFQLCLCCC